MSPDRVPYRESGNDTNDGIVLSADRVPYRGSGNDTNNGIVLSPDPRQGMYLTISVTPLLLMYAHHHASVMWTSTSPFDNRVTHFYLSVCLFVCLLACLFVCLFLFIYYLFFVCLFIYLFIYFTRASTASSSVESQDHPHVSNSHSTVQRYTATMSCPQCCLCVQV